MGDINAGLKQLAVRVDENTLKAIDKKRIEMSESLGKIPTRSEVVRMALEHFWLFITTCGNWGTSSPVLTGSK